MDCVISWSGCSGLLNLSSASFVDMRFSVASQPVYWVLVALQNSQNWLIKMSPDSMALPSVRSGVGLPLALTVVNARIFFYVWGVGAREYV